MNSSWSAVAAPPRKESRVFFTIDLDGHDDSAPIYSVEIGAHHMVFDRERDHDLLLSVGWDKSRVHGCVIPINLIDGNPGIRRDGPESGIAPDLEAAGAPKDRIVRAFKPPEIRPSTGYAVA